MADELSDLKKQLDTCQAELRASERRFQSAVMCAADGILIVDRIGRILFMNPAAEALFGRTAEEMRRLNFGFPVFAGESIEIDIIRRDGPASTVELRVTETEWEGEPGLLATLRDITERKAVEDKLRLLERAIEASHNGIVISDPHQADNPLIYISPGFERLTGYRAEELLGCNCRVLQGPDTQSEELDTIRAAVRAAVPCQVTIWNYRKDGTPFLNSLQIAPIFDDFGQLIHFIGIQTDITNSQVMRGKEKKGEAVER